MIIQSFSKPFLETLGHLSSSLNKPLSLLDRTWRKIPPEQGDTFRLRGSAVVKCPEYKKRDGNEYGVCTVKYYSEGKNCNTTAYVTRRIISRSGKPDLHQYNVYSSSSESLGQMIVRLSDGHNPKIISIRTVDAIEENPYSDVKNALRKVLKNGKPFELKNSLSSNLDIVF